MSFRKKTCMNYLHNQLRIGSRAKRPIAHILVGIRSLSTFYRFVYIVCHKIEKFDWISLYFSTIPKIPSCCSEEQSMWYIHIKSNNFLFWIFHFGSIRYYLAVVIFPLSVHLHTAYTEFFLRKVLPIRCILPICNE